MPNDREQDKITERAERADKIKWVLGQLVGSIEPYGETRTDEDRLDNMKVLVDVLDTMTDKVQFVAIAYAGDYRSSVSKIGAVAKAYIENKREA